MNEGIADSDDCKDELPQHYIAKRCRISAGRKLSEKYSKVELFSNKKIDMNSVVREASNEFPPPPFIFCLHFVTLSTKL